MLAQEHIINNLISNASLLRFGSLVDLLLPIHESHLLNLFTAYSSSNMIDILLVLVWNCTYLVVRTYIQLQYLVEVVVDTCTSM